ILAGLLGSVVKREIRGVRLPMIDLRGTPTNDGSKSYSLLLTSMCCDDTYRVTPRVSAFARCDILAFCFLYFLHDLFRPSGYSISEGPKKEPIEEEPLEEPNEEG
nr:hypothetical protein [Tanacetum cinerariifolium]